MKLLKANIYIGDDLGFLSQEKIWKLASEQNLVVFNGAHYSTVLQLDLDTDEAYATYQKNWPLVARFWDLTRIDALETRSKSGRKHVYVKTTSALKNATRIQLQAFLGSDATRELLSLSRLERAIWPASVLFETQEEAVRVKQFLDPVYEDVPF